MTNTPEVVRFFTAQHGVYDRFIQLAGYEQGLRAFLEPTTGDWCCSLLNAIG